MSTPTTGILLADAEARTRESLERWLQDEGCEVTAVSSAHELFERLPGAGWSIVLVDAALPGTDPATVVERVDRELPSAAVVIVAPAAHLEAARTAVEAGAYAYLPAPVRRNELRVTIERVVRLQELQRDNETLRRAVRQQVEFGDIVCASPAMRAACELARAAAGTDAATLLLGERGSGRRALARAIHAASDRRDAPFVAVDCAILTDELLEMELFGEGGVVAATTTAVAFDRADGGTLYLDEVGRIGGALQHRLMEAIDRRRMLGPEAAGTRGPRIMASTADDLRALVREGQFLNDLFAAISTITIAVPPLRQRRDDIPGLVDVFIEHAAAVLDRRVRGASPEAMALLGIQPFRGNVTELRSIVERAVNGCGGTVLQVDDVRAAGAAGAPAAVAESLEEVERRHVAAMLQQSGGNVSHAARILGIDRVTLYNKIRKYGLRGPARAAGQSR